MIFVSDHAFISKWWWIGAIRKTRRPKYLNVNTWMITESASITKMPPIRSSSNSTFMKIANAAIAPPSAIEPVSPMNTSAGKALYQRKPIAAPISAAPTIARSTAAMLSTPRCPPRTNVSTIIAVNVKSAIDADAGREAVDPVGRG